MAFLARNARWLLAGFLLTFSSSAGQTFFIALFATDLRGEFGLSHGDFGGVYMAATLASAASMIWLGKTADHIRIAPLAAAALAMLAATAFSMSQVGAVLGLVVVIFLLRLFGQGMPGHIALTAMARWFDNRRGRAISVAALGMPVGEAVLPIIMVALMLSIGWRGAWMVCAAGLALAILPLTYALLRREPEPPAALAEAGPPDANGRRHWTRAEVLRDPMFYALLIGILAPAFILTGVFFHQVHIVSVKGWSMAWWAAAFPAYSVGSVIASLLTGIAIDRWSAAQLLPLYLMPMIAGLTVLGLAEAPIAALAFMALVGATSGASLSLLGALWAELYGTRHLGAVRSIIMAAFVASTALAPGVMGWLIDAGVPIERQILIAAAYSGLATVFFFALGVRLRRRIAA